MADGPDDIDLDDAGGSEEGPILSPEELDITDDEHVTQLDEGRFVVSPDARRDEQTGGAGAQSSQSSQSREPQQSDSQSQPETQSQSQPSPAPDTQQQSANAEVTREEVHRWLRESFANGGSRYGFDVTATFDGSISQRRMASNDVVTIFESLILWYAQQIDNNTPVEEILGILLMEANVPVRYPPESLKNLVKSTGLGPDDTIADLLAAVSEDDGVEL